MKWLKKWAYLIVFAGVGFAYLTCVDEWQVYAKPMTRINQWIEEQTGEKGSDNQDQNTGDIAEGNTGGTDGAAVGDTVGDGEVGNAGDATPDNTGDVAEDNTGDAAEDNVVDAVEENAGEGADNVAEDNTGMPGGNVTENLGGEAFPTYMTVEDDYFADAVFIGDSRTVGMFEYGGLEEIATFYASTGLSVYEIFKSEFVTLPGQKKKVTVEEALQENSFAKIYLMLGINEMGTGTAETFVEKYAEVVARLQELQPDAIIYIQGIMKVSKERSDKGDYIHNEGIIARNEGIAALADNEKIFYLDVNPLICDETGSMVADYTWDGVHLKAKYIEIWKQFLKEHAVLKME